MAALTAPYNNFDQNFHENAIHYSFGCDPNAHLFGSPGLCWTGNPTIDAYAALLGEVVYLTEEEDSLFGGGSTEFSLQQLHGQPQQQQQLPPSTVVDTYKSTVVEERYNFEHQELNQIGKQIHCVEQQHREADFEEHLQHLADSPQICISDESSLTVDGFTLSVDSECGTELEIEHVPPPLNNKVPFLNDYHTFLSLQQGSLWSYAIGGEVLELQCEEVIDN